MAYMDLGLFLLLTGTGFAGLVIIRLFGILSIISGICFVFLALAMLSGYNVQSITHIGGYNATTSGTTNTTTITTAHDEKTDWITTNHVTLGYLFEMLAFLCFGLFFIVVVLGK